MVEKRSLGGIGSLYRDNVLLGRVYYNLKQDQPPGIIVCTLVFIDDEVDIPDDKQRYRLWLEDGRYLLVTLQKMRPVSHSPYVAYSCDGIFHAALTHTYSASNN